MGFVKEFTTFLHQNGIIKFGDFTLASGKKSSYYVDLRLVPSYPHKFREMVKDNEDLFMSGDKPHPYLDSAHKATENLIKMITASHKLLDLESESKDSVNANDILDLLDREGIAPKRFMPKSDDEKENDPEESDQSIVEFPQLNKRV